MQIEHLCGVEFLHTWQMSLVPAVCDMIRIGRGVCYQYLTGCFVRSIAACFIGWTNTMGWTFIGWNFIGWTVHWVESHGVEFHGMDNKFHGMDDIFHGMEF